METEIFGFHQKLGHKPKYFCLLPYQGRNHGNFLAATSAMVVESAPLGWDRVKVSENLGATSVAPVAPVVTSLHMLLPLLPSPTALPPDFQTLQHAWVLFSTSKPKFFSCGWKKMAKNERKMPFISHSSFGNSIWLTTCALTGVFWLLSHVIYLKLTRVL